MTNTKRGKKRDYFVVILGLLLISMAMNVFLSLEDNNYKDKVSLSSVKNIEEIRNKNDVNLSILDYANKDNKIKYIDLVILYKNFSDISKNITSLWEEYSFYDKKSINIFKQSKIDIDKTKLSNTDSRIEVYLRSILEENKNFTEEYFILEGNVLEGFIEMQNMSKNIKDFYNDFYNEKLSDVEHEEKSKKIIKKAYWIDILKGINEINTKYDEERFDYKENN